MTPDETVILARYVRALCPQQKFDEYTPDAWHDVLGEYTLNDARQAAARVAKRQPFVAPAEIADEITTIRHERTHNFVYEPPPGDRDPNYIANYRAQLAATGDGYRPPVVDRPALTARPVDNLLKQVGRQIPREVAAVRRPGPLGITCPDCRAPIGRPCRTNAGRERAPHENREHAALQPRTEETA